MKTLALIAAVSLVTPANGIDMLPFYDAGPKVERASHVSKPKKQASKPKPKKKTAAKKAAPTKVMAAEYRTEDVVRCIAPVRVVGSQDIREQAAEDSARKAWAEAVRWAHGESFQDIQNARDYQKRCARSSIGETMGQYFSRCEIVATPCRPAMVKGGGQ